LNQNQSYQRVFESFIALDLFQVLNKKQKLNLLKKWQQDLKVLT